MPDSPCVMSPQAEIEPESGIGGKRGGGGRRRGGLWIKFTETGFRVQFCEVFRDYSMNQQLF